jgi:pimeloyl-ACP methyl ester carboxylesterase
MGNPQHWREWRLIMPALVDEGYKAIAPDVRGFGYSDKPFGNLDVGTVGEDIHSRNMVNS